MIVTFTNYSSAVANNRVGISVDLEIDVRSFPPLSSKAKAPVKYAMDRKSHRATFLSVERTSTITFCKITEFMLPYIQELIDSTPRREYIELDNQGRTGHPSNYVKVLCTSDTLTPKRDGRLYTLTMGIEVHD